MITKKVFSCLLPLFLLPLFSHAQLQSGTIAPDWTLTDINKKTWHLYDLTSQGKTVFIDVSATWCGPCWRYHRQRSLDSLYEEHGPNGTIDQSCYVFLIEGDPNTTYADLNGTGTRTTGNWLAGQSFPVIDPGSDTIYPFRTNYNITYFPTVYMICPNNTIYLVGPGSKDVLYNNTKSGCPPVELKKPDSQKQNFTSPASHGNGFDRLQVGKANENGEVPESLFYEHFIIRKKIIASGK